MGRRILRHQIDQRDVSIRKESKAPGIEFQCRMFEPLPLQGPAMLLQFSVFPPLRKSPLEVSDVRTSSQSSSVRVERRMVLC